MQVPIMDLKRQYEIIKDEINKAIQDTIESCAFVAGEKVKQFEENFAQYCGVKYAVGVSSGTSALYVAFKALEIGKGDAVITVPYTFIATVEAITGTGARPIFVDIDEDSYTISPLEIEDYIKNFCRWDGKTLLDKTSGLNIRAILPVHLYGQMANMSEIMRIAKDYNLFVLEDSAQAHGATYKDKKAGSIGDVGAFSFYPSKNLGAYGQGGAVITNNKELAIKVRAFIDHGQQEKYYHRFEGWNFKMDGFQASILYTKLQYLDKWNDARIKNAHLYNKFLKESDSIKLPQEMPQSRHIYHLYVIRTIKRDLLQTFLKDNGIGTAIHYPIPLHLQQAYKYLGYSVGDFPVAERCANEVLSLPMFPELTEQEVSYVCDHIKKFKT